ncbi:MAG: hypothetical protein H0T78_04650 [Longispora sp.]|nr:hypothetical protein [Longispora sp. (in: high G+C Gram-positive bacteria)]
MQKSRVALAVITASIVAVAGLGSASSAIPGKSDSYQTGTLALGGKRSHEFPNFRGFKQEQSNWCYAAVSQSVLHAFGKEISQVEIAHKMIFHFGESVSLLEGNLTSAEKKMADYYWYVSKMEGTSEQLAHWEYVEAHVSKKKEMLSILHSTSGNPNVDELTFVGDGTPVTDEQIIETIDRDGLIIVLRSGKSGIGAHFTIIHGYTVKKRFGKTTLRVRVFDPLGGDTVLSAKLVRSNMRQSYRIVGVATDAI